MKQRPSTLHLNLPRQFFAAIASELDATSLSFWTAPSKASCEP